jgi:hypothetical protein
VLKKFAFYRESPPCTAEDFLNFEREVGKPPGRTFREFCEQCRGGALVEAMEGFPLDPYFAKILRDNQCLGDGSLILVSYLKSLHEDHPSDKNSLSTLYWSNFLRTHQPGKYPEDKSLFCIGSNSGGDIFLANICEDEPWVHLWDREYGTLFTVATSLAGFYNGLTHYSVE